MKVEKPVESVTAAEQKEDDSGLTYCKAYFQAFLVCCSFGLGVHSYYTLAGVQTSLHELKGSVGLALVWFFFILSAILTPVCFRIIGLKATYVLGVLGYCVYPLSNFYDGWFTIVPGFVFVGLASGPLCAGASTYMTVVAEGLVERYGNVGEKYRGIFQGLAMMSIFGGAMFGNGLLSVFLYHDLDNTTNFTTNISTLDNQTFRTNSSYLDAQSLFSNDSSVCSRDVGITSVSYLYYYLIGVCLFLTVLATILSTFLINTGNRVACSQVPSELCSSLKRTVKMFLQLKYIIPVTLVFYTGVDQGFFFGQFTLHFVSTCLGLGAVGLAVIVYCFGVMLSSLSVGWISIHLTRTLVVVVSAFLQAGMILFMLFWEREASYVMVFLTSLGWGVVDGVWMTLPAIYLTAVSKKEVEHSPRVKYSKRGSVDSSAVPVNTQHNDLDDGEITELTVEQAEIIHVEEEDVEHNSSEEKGIEFNSNKEKDAELNSSREEPKSDDDQIFGLFWAPYALGGSISFCIISVSTLISAKLWLLLALLVSSCCLFVFAEAKYGEKILRCGRRKRYAVSTEVPKCD